MIRDHQVTLDNGLADDIVHHDVDELLKNPLYRMPTPAEQEAWARAEQEKHAVHEQAQNPVDAVDQSEQGEKADETDDSDLFDVDVVLAQQQQAMEQAPPARTKRPYKKRG